MLFTAPDSLIAPKGSALLASEEPSIKELHLIAVDKKISESYGLTLVYQFAEAESITGGTRHRFTVSKTEMFWLFKELGGDKLTHYRRDDSKKQTYRPIAQCSIDADGITIRSYYRSGRITVDFTN